MTVVDEIKARVDLVDLVGEYVDLRRSGKNYIALCPFHEERTPSFVVFPETQTWKCFGCGKGGDVFTFVQEKENLDFRDALRVLARRAGVPLHEGGGGPEPHAHLRELLEEAAIFFRHHLRSTSGRVAYEYLRGRGLSDATIETFGLGYAPAGYEHLLRYFREQGRSVDDLIQAGLVTRREDTGRVYDRFRHRVMFPIRDERGRMAGFGARTLDPDGVPKYLNSPQGPLFDKGRLLYGLDKAKSEIRRRGQAVVVEGYMDVIALHQAGHGYAVAPMGTALTEHHLRLLKRYTREIVLALDPDAAGQRAVLRSLDVARQATEGQEPVLDARGFVHYEQRLDVQLRVVVLPEGLDPDELVRQGPARWEQLLDQARPVLLFVMDTRFEQLSADDPRARGRFAQDMADLIRQVANPVEREAYIRHLAELLGASYNSVAALVTRRRHARPRSRRAQAQPAAQAPRAPRREQVLLGLLLTDTRVRALVDRCLRAADLAPVSADDFRHGPHRALWQVWTQALEQIDLPEEEYLARHLDPALKPVLQACRQAVAELAPQPQPRRAREALLLVLSLRREATKQVLEQQAELLRLAPPHEQEAHLEAIQRAQAVLKNIDVAEHNAKCTTEEAL